VRRADWTALVLIAIATLRIAFTYTLFSATVDEPMHISAGLELLEEHRYAYQPENPPLPRLVLAFAPWVGGMELDPAIRVEEQLQRVFHSRGRYEANLVLSRAGNLVFFLIATLAIWFWTRRTAGPWGAAIAVCLFTVQPVILGHAGLATLDMAATAGVAVALVAFSGWLDRPSLVRAVALGAAFGFAVLCKFSSLGYVPAACVAMYVARWIGDTGTLRAWRRIPAAFASAAVTGALVIWAGYAFTVARAGDLVNAFGLSSERAAGRFIARHPSWPLPAPAFVRGVAGLAELDRSPFYAYLLGDISPRGFRRYFPVALALKTTLASLLLALAGLFLMRQRLIAESLAASVAILAVSMTSHLNLGVRYVLPIYAPLTVAAAASAAFMLRSNKRPLQAVALTLLVWHGVASAVANRDGLAYFNEIAAPRPWLYLLDSNLDWGQDVLRLRRVVREKEIPSLGLALMGWHDYEALGFPPHYPLQTNVPSQGWVAISEHWYGLGKAPWLAGRKYERVGKSIRLYYIR
jgi:4-amino-4-deoxy-L-arabinose transferase-like glycosyltransferase